MTRLWERLIDLLVLMRAASPEISGVIVAGAVQFWMTKNASAPHPADPAIMAAAEAAAKLAVAAATAAAGLEASKSKAAA